MGQAAEQIAPEYSAQDLCAVDAWYWAYYNRLKLASAEFSLKGHEYQVDPLRCDARLQCAKKGAQMGWTEVEGIKSLHGMIFRRYPQGVFYLFPTAEDVSDFSKSRFNPLIAKNECIGMHIRNTDAVQIKEIGDSVLYLRGARATQRIKGVRQTSSKLKSAPADRVVFDEYDEMAANMVQLARQRLGHSEVKEESYLSTPSIPDHGIDLLYKSSTQAIWLIRCEHCGTETCLEIEFPDCLLPLADGRVIRVCKKCKREIYPHNGYWVHRDPAAEMVGWWISQLNSIYVDPAEILNEFENPPNGDITEVYNSRLAEAYIERQNQLTPNDVLSCCSNDAQLTRCDGPCAAGADIGKVLNLVIGYKFDDGRLKAVKFIEVETFNDMLDVFKRFNVRCAVLDMRPETHAARDFQKTAAQYKIEVFLCEYKEHLAMGQKRDTQKGIIFAHRTEICDQSHQLVTTKGRYEIPRQCEDVDIYVHQMCGIAKTKQEDEETKEVVFRYVNIHPDHYRHATNYFMLVAHRVNPFVHGTPRRQRQLYADD